MIKVWKLKKAYKIRLFENVVFGEKIVKMAKMLENKGFTKMLSNSLSNYISNSFSLFFSLIKHLFLLWLILINLFLVYVLIPKDNQYLH